jgi:hypothetical protein
MPNTTQPPQQLRRLPSCNASEHYPREHHPSRNNADAASTRYRATRQTPVINPATKPEF